MDIAPYCPCHDRVLAVAFFVGKGLRYLDKYGIFKTETKKKEVLLWLITFTPL